MSGSSHLRRGWRKSARSCVGEGGAARDEHCLGGQFNHGGLVLGGGAGGVGGTVARLLVARRFSWIMGRGRGGYCSGLKSGTVAFPAALCLSSFIFDKIWRNRHKTCYGKFPHWEIGGSVFPLVQCGGSIDVVETSCDLLIQKLCQERTILNFQPKLSKQV